MITEKENQIKRTSVFAYPNPKGRRQTVSCGPQKQERQGELRQSPGSSCCSELPPSPGSRPGVPAPEARAAGQGDGAHRDFGRGRGEGAWSSDLKDRRVSGTRLAPRKQNERGVHSAGIWKGRRLSALLGITREEQEYYPCNCFAGPAFSTRRHRFTIPFFFF